MEFFTTTGKLKKFFFFLQLEMFDVSTTGDMAHIDTIFNLLPHTRQVRYVRSSARHSIQMYQRGSQWTDLRKILYWRLFSKNFQEIPNLVQAVEKLSTLHEDLSTFY
jgi:hypothetical protein